MSGRSESVPSTTTCSPALKSFEDEPVIFMPLADNDRPLIDPAILADHPDKMPLGTLLDGCLRQKDGIGPDGAFQTHAHILVRTQHALGVVDTGANQKCSGLRVVRWLGKGDPPGMRVD